MPAYFDTGFSVREPAWHGQALVLDDYPKDWPDARSKAGLEWEPTYKDLWVEATFVAGDSLPDEARHVLPADPEQHPVATTVLSIQDPTDDEGGRIAAVDVVVMVPVEGFKAIARDDTRAVLATPTDSYELIYHWQMGELIEAYTKAWQSAGASVKFETAGAIKGGRGVWVLVWLDEPYTITGDDSETYPFSALLNWHDGMGACKLLPTQVRIICWNTWNAASMAGDHSGHQVIIRHAGNVSDRLESAKDSLRAMRDEANDWQMKAEHLASININDAVVRTFLDQFIPVPENASERTRESRKERQATFRALYEQSPTVAPLPDTAYKLVQAGGEYLDHMRPFRNRDTYLSRTMLRPEAIKGGVVTLVEDLARELVTA